VTPDRTATAIEARRRATGQKLQQVRDPIATLRQHKSPVTYPVVARRAAVSRTFLYENPAARALISEAISKTAGQRTQAQPRPALRMRRPVRNARSTPRLP
jgi:hypothetical protein